MTEALFAVGKAVEGQADFLGLSQHFLGQIALGKLPVVILAGEDVGEGQEDALDSAVLVESEGGDADDVDRGVAAEDVGKDGLLIAHDAAGLNVDQNGAAGQLFELLFESKGYVADNGTLNGVDFRVGEGNGLISGCGNGAQRKDHAQCHGECQELFHLVFLRF